jgi:hypothetical protein
MNSIARHASTLKELEEAQFRKDLFFGVDSRVLVYLYFKYSCIVLSGGVVIWNFV